MALISIFQCKKCGREFSLQAGLLERDLLGVKEGKELPCGGHLPNKEVSTKIASQKALEETFAFNNTLLEHQKKCDGEVVLKEVIFAH